MYCAYKIEPGVWSDSGQNDKLEPKASMLVFEYKSNTGESSDIQLVCGNFNRIRGFLLLSIA
ncbi:hypothetical protein COO91_09189 (plasmid) [Nostoc flagelliforme CCNUN1]|uniref:Uncharacterized protein n=1 Tax=Nostoc flagelliforme CCNUN1 TaxID=2038116 RepID=A0A2K8T625_9NOSO|nr:hypothetical protein COO91_09189 [Nostoc flagelliforme CCNUN1]